MVGEVPDEFEPGLLSYDGRRQAEWEREADHSATLFCQELAQGDERTGSISCNECLRIMKNLPSLYSQILEGIDAENGELIGGANSQISGIIRDLAKGRNCPTI